MRLLLPLFSALATTLVAASAFAAEPVSLGDWSEPTVHTHDGFFLRLSAGPGGAFTEYADALVPVSAGGGSADINLAIGGIVVPNLAAHATLWGWSVAGPTFEIGDQELKAEEDAALSMSAIGAGVTYWVDDWNLYLSGSIGLARLLLEDSSGTEYPTANGVATDLTVGKEWWVSDNWGIGAALGLGWHSIPDEKRDDESWKGASFGLRFSATYN